MSLAQVATERKSDFQVVSDGRTGAQVLQGILAKRFFVNPFTKGILESDQYAPTSGTIRTFQVLRGDEFPDKERTDLKIRARGRELNLFIPSLEDAALLCENIPEEEITAMGFTDLIIMHEPVKDCAGHDRILGIHHFGGSRELISFFHRRDRVWDNRTCGFAFLQSQSNIAP